MDKFLEFIKKYWGILLTVIITILSVVTLRKSSDDSAQKKIVKAEIKKNENEVKVVEAEIKKVTEEKVVTEEKIKKQDVTIADTETKIANIKVATPTVKDATAILKKFGKKKI